MTEKVCSQHISHELVLVENVLEKLCTFGLCAQKWEWTENKYVIYFKIALALKIMHISIIRYVVVMERCPKLCVIVSLVLKLI